VQNGVSIRQKNRSVESPRLGRGHGQLFPGPGRVFSIEHKEVVQGWSCRRGLASIDIDQSTAIRHGRMSKTRWDGVACNRPIDGGSSHRPRMKEKKNTDSVSSLTLKVYPNYVDKKKRPCGSRTNKTYMVVQLELTNRDAVFMLTAAPPRT